MSRQLPATANSTQPAQRSDVVVLETERGARGRAAGSIARTALQLTPDVLRLIERSRSAAVATAPPPAVDQRVYTEGVRFTEERHESRLPWARNVTVRTATAWQTSAPSSSTSASVPDSELSARLRRAGLMSVGGAAALAACGLLLKSGVAAALGGRRVRRVGGR